jgi:hypothetical protein
MPSGGERAAIAFIMPLSLAVRDLSFSSLEAMSDAALFSMIVGETFAMPR